MSLVDRAAAEPEPVLREAVAALASARGAERVRLRLAACLAHVELGEPAPAARHARLALAAAERAGLGGLAASVRLARAWLAVDRGRPRAALAELDRARGLAGVELAKARCLRGAAYFALREPAEAELTAAVAGLTAEPRWLANALIVRGADACYRGQAVRGRADFAAAEGILAELGLPERAAVCVHNQGFAALRSGDSVAALRLFDAAEQAGADPLRHPEMLLDRAEALPPEEAGPVLRRAIVLLRAAGKERKLAEAMVSLARCSLRGRDFAAAAGAALEAVELLRRQRRPGWAALARALGLHSTLLARTGGSLGAVGRIADRCARAGWSAEADELRLVAGRIALRDGREALGRRLLGQIHGKATRWRARAELAGGGEVLRVCRRGLRAGWDQELAEFGLGAALADGDAATVLRWARRCRGDELAGPDVLEYFVHENRIWVGCRGRVHRLGEVRALRLELAGWRLAGGSALGIQRLVWPAAEIGAAVTVVVPEELAGVPWGALPALAGRETTVLPPGWKPGVPRSGEPLWVAGPGLPGAEAEVRALHAVHGGRLLVRARVAETLRAVASAGTVHVAAHGRQHNGCLELADGPVRLAEVLARAGGLTVLSACGLGRVLRAGRGAVIASVVEVADAGTGAMMLALHERLRHEPPAAALAAVARLHGHRGFVCVGQAVSLPRRSRASSRTSSRLQ
ncbi:CHAT domain-containing protein [Crossiella cryophila]|uniref:Tetratricopeptide (TPR) repeat protein n=1 Tax=Crossiella cryophila TaxID=43355 RepID=A0A7W7C4W8_9PSEU|nr:CHAT domain-containing protein [Crossiella cryophila]MBB4674549.1 tetratricopeptide (TPR) repeat protein [Crossiella cryophila]